MEAEPDLRPRGSIRPHRRGRPGPGSCRRATRGRRRGRCRGRRRGRRPRLPSRRSSRRRTRRASRTAGAPRRAAARSSSRTCRGACAGARACRAARRPGRGCCPSRSRIAAGLNSRTRAAASSIASGRPSRRSADLADRGERLTLGDEVRALRPGAVDEQGDGRVDVERRDRVPALAGHPEQLAAGHQDAAGRERRGPVAPRSPRPREAAARGCPARGGRSAPGGGRGGPRAAVRAGVSRTPRATAIAGSTRAASRTRREVHEPDAVRETGRERGRDREGQPGLAAAAGSGQGDDAAAEQRRLGRGRSRRPCRRAW